MKELQKMISDETLEHEFRNTNYGGSTPREVVAHTLLKRASLYHCGFISVQICIGLGLLTPKKHSLTNKGGEYLWKAFSKDATF